MALVEFVDGPLAGTQHDANDDDTLLTVLATLPGPMAQPVQLRYRREGITSDGLARFVQV